MGHEILNLLRITTAALRRWYVPAFHIAFWLFMLSMINADFRENWFDKSVRPSNLSPISVLLFPLIFYLNVYYLIPRFLKSTRWYTYFLIVFLLMISLESIRSLLFVWVNNAGLQWSYYAAEWMSKDNLIFGIPNSLWFAFFLSFGYRFTYDWIENNRVIRQLKYDQVNRELESLKSQINPHFLFNNLNALDDLIDDQNIQAKTYLQCLSRLYRYLLKNIQEDFVTLQAEWDFMHDYVYLLQQRFGEIYQFSIQSDINNLREVFIPPSSLQTLIENAVKHNQASQSNPLEIHIEVNEAGISVWHKKI